MVFPGEAEQYLLLDPHGYQLETHITNTDDGEGKVTAEGDVILLCGCDGAASILYPAEHLPQKGLPRIQSKALPVCDRALGGCGTCDIPQRVQQPPHLIQSGVI